MATYNNTLHDLISFLKASDEGRSSFSSILPTVVSLEMDGISGIVIGNLFSINKQLLPDSYTGLDYVVKKIKQSIQTNTWTTTIEAYPFKHFDGDNNIDGIKQKINNAINNSSILNPHILNFNSGGVSSLSIPPDPNQPLPTQPFDKNGLSAVVNFFKAKGYSNYGIAALVGGLIQESGLVAISDSVYNGIEQFGLAQWTANRLASLRKKSLYNTQPTQLNFIAEELQTTHKSSGDILKKATTLEEALAASQKYEAYAIEGKRRNYAIDIYNRLATGSL